MSPFWNMFQSKHNPFISFIQIYGDLSSGFFFALKSIFFSGKYQLTSNKKLFMKKNHCLSATFVHSIEKKYKIT